MLILPQTSAHTHMLITTYSRIQIANIATIKSKEKYKQFNQNRINCNGKQGNAMKKNEFSYTH